MGLIDLLERAEWDALAVAVTCGYLVAPWDHWHSKVLGSVIYVPRFAEPAVQNTLVACALMALSERLATPGAAVYTAIGAIGAFGGRGLARATSATPPPAIRKANLKPNGYSRR